MSHTCSKHSLTSVVVIFVVEAADAARTAVHRSVDRAQLSETLV